ncbi:hypothetical protein LMG28727_06401 [Paraburkholderia kirstenboschensis]|nr:hypothetical protein LMG28727_06401 [Paraburkholderia kirstenboschensis]
MVSVTALVAPEPPNVTLLFVVSSYATNALVTTPLLLNVPPIACNCATLTASLVATPLATLVSVTALVAPEPPNVTLLFVVSSYATNALVTTPLLLNVPPIACNCATLTASVVATPLATLVSVTALVAPDPPKVTLSLVVLS